MLSVFDAVVLGVVEGLTEFLPISSTGHLILTQHFMGLPESAGLDAYLVAVQFGAILAVLALYGRRFVQMFVGLGDLVRGKSTLSRQLDLNLLIAFIPAAVVGVCAEHFIKQELFNPMVVALSLMVGAVVMWVASFGKKQHVSVDQMGPKSALVVGLWQVLSLIPGMSRSMTTIVGGMSQRLSAAAAAEFSFLLGAVTLTAASGYELWDKGGEILALGLMPVLVGFGVAFISAILGIKILVGALNRWGLAPWAWYRVALAMIVLGALWR